MRAALALVEKNVADGAGGPFGAIVVHSGQIIGEGTNLVTRSNDPTAHAEVVTIRQACSRLSAFSLGGCMIYTSCEPCTMCLSAIYWARLDHIFYGNTKVDAAKINYFDDAHIYRGNLQAARRTRHPDRAATGGGSHQGVRGLVDVRHQGSVLTDRAAASRIRYQAVKCSQTRAKWKRLPALERHGDRGTLARQLKRKAIELVEHQQPYRARRQRCRRVRPADR